MNPAQFLAQFTQLVSVAPGDLVYHLVVLFAIEATLMIAIGEGRRSNWRRGTLRVVLAAGGLLLARCLLVIVALLSAARVANSAWIAPPLERLVSVVSLGLLIWAFLPLMEDYPQAGLVLVVVNLVGGLVLYAVLAPQWYAESQLAQKAYNVTPADWAWNIWAAAMAFLALVAAAIRRRGQWGMLIAAFGLLFLGHVLHLIMGEAQAHVAGWVRLAELCAYPVLAGLMVRRAAEPEEPARAAPAQSTTTPWTVIETCQRVADSPNVKVALQRAGVAICNVVNADVLAIGLWDEVSDTVELAAVCRTGEPARSGPSFDLDSQAPIQAAISRQRGILVGADQEAQRASLSALMGGAAGPLWVQPLVYQRTTVGVLVAGRPHATSGWTPGDIQTLGGLCGVLAAALSAARKATALTHQVDELTQRAHEQETALSQAQAQLQSSRDELRQLGAQIEAMRRGARSADPVVRQREALRPPPAIPAKPPLASDTDSAYPTRRAHFFEQAKLQLEQFDEARGRLVISPGDQNALSALVQAVHTIKDKSATMGYNTLAKLAGTLAESLRRVRADRQPVTPDMLALIGEAASALRVLLADVQADRPPSLDATPLLSRLASSPAARGAEEMTGTLAGAQMMLAKVRLRRDTPLKPARAMMVLMQIKRVGQIVACQPVEADLRSGGFEDEFTVRFTTTSKPEVVRAALSAIPDVTSVDVSLQ